MATSVQNRLHHLEPGFHGHNRSYNKSGLGHRSGSPARSYSLHEKEQNLLTGSTYDEYSSSDEDDYNTDYKEMIVATNAELLEPSVYDSRDEGTSDNWIERNSSMVRLTGKHPFNSEAPLPRLMQHGFITPVPLHYVRNHGPVPSASWDTWTVEICGLVKRPIRFTMDQLVNEFPSREIPVTLVCAGNRRKEQNMTKKSIGFNWGAAAISNSVWRGVPLHHVLKKCGIFSRKTGALNICFEGAEDLPGGGGSKYGTSIKKEFAMDPSRDIMLAYMQNGERLAPDHGFPVRIIIPGFIGGRMVKWLKRIIVTTQESDSYYHWRDNKVLPSHVDDAELANAEAWWYKPEYSITELNTNSVITTPCHEEILAINPWTTQTPYTLKGYAYSGGGKKVIRVEVTLDGGDSWIECKVDHQEKPNKYGKYWCWCLWSLDLDLMALLSSKEIAVRAWDESHNTQPDKLNWNLMGMMNNCWFRVKTSLHKPRNGEIGIVFEHPVQPGNQSGGWMPRQKQLEESYEANKIVKRTLSSPFFMANASNDRIFTMSDLKRHNSVDSSWIAIHGHVYDCTTFLKDHPGGADSILINAGTDCTEEFDAIHSDKAKQLLEPYRIGELAITENSPPSSLNDEVMKPQVLEHGEIKQNIALVGREKVVCKLVEKTSISHDVKLFRFALPSSDQVLGLSVGKHIYLCATIDGKPCMRAYTPSSSVDAVGYFDLVVKIYFKDPNYPNGGIMSQHLDSIPLGSTLHIKGPVGHIEYLGKGKFMVSGKQKFAKKLAMIAGGTGITPIYQVMQAILADPEDETKMFVVFANRTENDILLKNEIDAWAEKYKERIKIWYVIGKKLNQDWKYSVGRISESILREHIPAGSVDTLALACGPPAMITHAVTPNLIKMGYDTGESLLVF